MRTLLVLACTVLLALAPGVAGLSAFAKDGSSETARELERIKREMEEKKKELKRAGRKERSVLAELDKIDRDIQAGSDELVAQQKKLQEAEAGARGIEANSASLSRELAGVRKAYGLRLRALYKMRRSGVAGPFAADSVGSMVKQVKYLGLIAAPEGVRAVQQAHPEVALYLAAVDTHLNALSYIVPGLGDAGDRQFATM